MNRTNFKKGDTIIMSYVGSLNLAGFFLLWGNGISEYEFNVRMFPAVL